MNRDNLCVVIAEQKLRECVRPDCRMSNSEASIWNKVQ